MDSFEKGRLISELNREGRVVVKRQDLVNILLYREGTEIYNVSKISINRSLMNQRERGESDEL